MSSFQIGKYYRHATGKCMHIIGGVETTDYGWSLVAESHGESDLMPVGQDEGNRVNWEEITLEDWMGCRQVEGLGSKLFAALHEVACCTSERIDDYRLVEISLDLWDEIHAALDQFEAESLNETRMP